MTARGQKAPLTPKIIPAEKPEPQRNHFLAQESSIGAVCSMMAPPISAIINAISPQAKAAATAVAAAVRWPMFPNGISFVNTQAQQTQSGYPGGIATPGRIAAVAKYPESTKPIAGVSVQR